MERTDLIYAEDEYGTPQFSFLEEYLGKAGVWALWGRNKKTGKMECLNVGKTVDVSYEIGYDLHCMKHLRVRTDGDREYINQFNEDCEFKYKVGQVQEYLYPTLTTRYHSFRYIYVDTEPTIEVEYRYAKENHAIYWRNGRPYKSIQL